MKNILKLILTLAFILPTQSFAALQGSPFMPEVDQRFNTLEQSALSVPSLNAQNIDTAVGTLIKHYARARLAVLSGTSLEQGSRSLGVTIPKNALITGGYVYFQTQLVAATGVPSQTIAIFCEDAGNLLAASDLTVHTAGSVISLIPKDWSHLDQLVRNISANCALSAEVSGTALVGGLADVFVEYFITD